ncbi:hypothetical protein [Mycobacterium sp.]|uniref:hypothetical protein n=1 Tax=Mycobacterium sp. TaxID=1785 RepID=UPI0025DF261A|nr:hypothetical protein [Mycobacterium sp.]
MTHTSTPDIAREDSSSKRVTWNSPRTLAISALVIAVVAAAVAIAAWLHPGSSQSYSGEQISRAKANVCAAWAPVHKSVWVGTPNPLPGDPVAQLSVAANVRLAMLGGGSYLRETLAAEPATPADLAKAVTTVANTLQKMGINYLAMSDGHTVIDPLHHDLEVEGAQIGKLCK